MRHDAVLPVKISENLREGMFDQACFGQYGQFQADILSDIETDMLFREVCRNDGESKFLLPEFAISQCCSSSQEQEGKVC